MPENPNITEGQTPVNLDEIEPDAADSNGDDVECPDSPTGNHEFDTDAEEPDKETCVYCGTAKEE